MVVEHPNSKNQRNRECFSCICEVRPHTNLVPSPMPFLASDLLRICVIVFFPSNALFVLEI